VRVVDPGRVQVEPDTRPAAVRRLAAAKHRPQVVQFSRALPEPLLDALVNLLDAHPEVALYIGARHARSDIDPSLAFLARFERVRDLSISVWGATSFDALGGLKALESLHLGQTRSTRPSLGFLRELPNLHTLSVESHSKNFAAVGEIAELRHMRLWAPRVKSLDCLARHRRLTTLEMSFGGIRELHALSRVPNLRGLRLYQVRNLDTDDLAALAGFPTLEYVSLGGLRNVERLTFLRGQPSKTLRYLNLETMAGLQTLEDIALCERLEELLVIGDARPADKRLEPLVGVGTLEHVGLGGSYPRAQLDLLKSGFSGKSISYQGRYLIGNERSGSRLSWRTPVSLLID
jgi:hypothetical protein